MSGCDQCIGDRLADAHGLDGDHRGRQLVVPAVGHHHQVGAEHPAYRFGIGETGTHQRRIDMMRELAKAGNLMIVPEGGQQIINVPNK